MKSKILDTENWGIAKSTPLGGEIALENDNGDLMLENPLKVLKGQALKMFYRGKRKEFPQVTKDCTVIGINESGLIYA